ncbi:3563_t:CDS:2 [Entrophospora sp. SA101]|nr:14257_t:CDS:2 [Entrophospora sp. SA101]CAJ0766192.1 3563_t:CDS:2 [Entrophospora sp. SA101]
MNEGLPERPSYRSGRKPTAVKVYTINKESKHQILHDYPCEEFTEVLWVKFASLPEARAAKRKVNEHIFFNSPLKVRYAPEYESVEDTREKLQERCQVIAIKTQKKIFQYKQIGYPSQTHYEHYDQNLFSTYHQPQQSEQTGNDNSAGKRYYSQTQSNKETSNQSQKNRRRI